MMQLKNDHLHIVPLDKVKTGLINRSALRSIKAHTARKSAVTFQISVMPRQKSSQVNKWAIIPSFTYCATTYTVVKYRRKKTIQRYGCTCKDFLFRKGCNEGKGFSRTCKHIRLFRKMEEEQLNNTINA